MPITNNLIALDSTAQSILTEMDRENALLSACSESSRGTVFSDIHSCAQVIRANTVEQNRRIFPVGGHFTIPWKDMDDPAHNTDETAYQVALDVVHHDNVELQTGEIVPGMFVQWHKCTPYGVQFSNYQAFKNCPEGLPAGTYSITLGASWGGKGAIANTSWCFTLTQDVPVGGCLSGFEALPDVLSTTWCVKNWASKDAATPIETVVVSPLGDTVATSLGTMNMFTVSEDGLNGMQQVGYGHNRWGTSATRQYLNALGNNWWSSQDDFDIRPNEYAKHGFLSGFSQDFLDAIRPVKVTTALNIVEGFESDREETFDRFFPPSLEQMNGTPQLATVEGPHFEYWRMRLGLSGFASGRPSVYDGYKVPAINSDSAQHVRLRSAGLGNACFVWCATSYGYIGTNSASSANRSTPVCVIC